jgi:hypothetical protein
MTSTVREKLDETLLVANPQYEVWSPFDAAGAAGKLMKLLQDEKNPRNASELPSTDEWREFVSELPEDLRVVLARLDM